jgi:hypothetical protein
MRPSRKPYTRFGDRKDRDADATGQADEVTDRWLYALDCGCSYYYLMTEEL